MPEKIIFLDRDGVINEDKIGGYIEKWSDYHFIPGVLESMKRLRDDGFKIIIISNQAGIGDGVYKVEALNEITEKMTSVMHKAGIDIAGTYYCLHGQDEGCSCRKPEPGLFKQAARDFDFVPEITYFVGDKVTDMQAGKSFGLKLLFVLTGHGKHDQNGLTENVKPETISPSLVEATDYLIGQEPAL